MAEKNLVGAEIRRTTIGGQALIEGLMMIGPDKCAVSVRLQNGLIYREEKPAPAFGPAGKLPFIRGSIRLFKQLFIGMKALTRSADLAEMEGADLDRLPVSGLYQTASQPYVPEPDLDRAAAHHLEEGNAAVEEKSNGWLYGLAMALGAVFGIALFIFLPNLIITALKYLLGGEAKTWTVSLGYNLLEGLVRIAILLLYMWLTGRSKEIARLWQYHGAEHKTIACYEHGMPLTVENVRLCSRFHPRCGTSFLFLVVFISALVFSLFGWHGMGLNILIRLLLIPVVIGISFELQRYSGSRVDRPLGRLITRPGLWLQRLTTREPDDEIMETAINAMLAVLPQEEGADDWN